MEQRRRLFPSRVICITNPARIARSPVLANYYLILESLLPWTEIRGGGPVAKAETTRAFVVASIPVPARVMNRLRTPEIPASTLARIPHWRRLMSRLRSCATLSKCTSMRGWGPMRLPCCRPTRALPPRLASCCGFSPAFTTSGGMPLTRAPESTATTDTSPPRTESRSTNSRGTPGLRFRCRIEPLRVVGACAVSGAPPACPRVSLNDKFGAFYKLKEPTTLAKIGHAHSQKFDFVVGLLPRHLYPCWQMKANMR